MKKILLGTIVLLGLVVLLQNNFIQKNDFCSLKIDENNRYCYPNAPTSDEKVFFVYSFNVTNKSNKSIKFKVKIKNENNELIDLVGDEVNLIQNLDHSSKDIFEVGANITQSISGIVPTEIHKSEFDKITHGFKDFDVILFKDSL